MSSAFNIPAGFALVPLELKGDNLFSAWRAAGGVLRHDKLRYIYGEMIAAAPPVDAVPGEPVAYFVDWPNGGGGTTRAFYQGSPPGAYESDSHGPAKVTPLYAASVASRAGSEPVWLTVCGPTTGCGLQYAGGLSHCPNCGKVNFGRTVGTTIAPAAAAEPSERHDQGFSKGWDAGFAHGKSRDEFLHGICVALSCVVSMDCGVTWAEIVRTAGIEDMLQFAAFIEPEEWELAGFAKYAMTELRRAKPRKPSKRTPDRAGVASLVAGEMRPTYYVAHPDGTYTVADPQP